MPDAPAIGAGTSGVIAPPPLMFAGTLALGVALDAIVGTRPLLPPLPRLYLAAVLFVAAIAIFVWAIGLFRRAGTPAPPWVPSTTLVTHGIYNRTRNPMYVGFTLAYVAIALGFGGPITLALLLPLVIILHYGVVLREERYLTGLFGEPYRDYTRRVRRYV